MTVIKLEKILSGTILRNLLPQTFDPTNMSKGFKALSTTTREITHLLNLCNPMAIEPANNLIRPVTL